MIPDFDKVMPVGFMEHKLAILDRGPAPSRNMGDTMVATMGRQSIAPETFEVRPTAVLRGLSDRRRRELMILPRLMHRVLENDYHGGTNLPDHPDVFLIKRLLTDAMVEPINGLLPISRAEKLLEQINDHQQEIFRAEPLQCKREKIAAILWHVIKILLDEGTLVLVEGSCAADAFITMMPLFEHVLDHPRRDRSAKKQARLLLPTFHKLGYFYG